MPDLAEELESSISPEPQDEVSESPSGSDVEATMEDAIRDVLEAPVSDDDMDAPAESEPEVGPDSSPDSDVVAEDSTEEPVAELTEEQLVAALSELKDENLPLGKIERFKAIVAEKNEYKTELEGLRPVKSQLDQIEAKAVEAGMSNDELVNLFSLPVVLASDPDAALQTIDEFRDRLAGRLGHSLPDELKQKVDDGYMDEDSAKRLAKAEAQREFDSQRAQVTQEQAQQQAAQQRSNAIVTAVNTFDQRLRDSDPSYDTVMQGMVKDRLLSLRNSEGLPPTPDKAVEMAQRAFDEVRSSLQAMQPQRRQVRSVSGRGANRPAATAPQNMLEALTAAVNNPED